VAHQLLEDLLSGGEGLGRRLGGLQIGPLGGQRAAGGLDLGGFGGVERRRRRATLLAWSAIRAWAAVGSILAISPWPGAAVVAPRAAIGSVGLVETRGRIRGRRGREIVLAATVGRASLVAARAAIITSSSAAAVVAARGP